MKPVTREQWTAALRSGDYPQTKGVLRRPAGGAFPQGYCCLGVLMRLAGAENVNVCPGLEIAGLKTPHNAHLPDEVASMVGINWSMQGKLASKNDSGKTFKEIADMIDNIPFNVIISE